MATNKQRRMKDILGSLEYDELINLQRDLFGGGSRLKQMVSTKIKEISETEHRTCATCGNQINLRVAQEFTLIFGTQDVKKRASFCAIDCMEYFTRNMKALTGQKVNSKKPLRQ